MTQSVGQAGNDAFERGRSLFAGLYSTAGNLLSFYKPVTEPAPEMELDQIQHQSRRGSHGSLKSNGRHSITQIGRNVSVTERPPNSPEKNQLSERNSVTSEKYPEGVAQKEGKDRFEKVRPVLRSDPSKSQQAAMERLKALNPLGRLDFVLQESVLENPYLSSLGVHMSYWIDQDVNGLIIRSLYHSL